MICMEVKNLLHCQSWCSFTVSIGLYIHLFYYMILYNQLVAFSGEPWTTEREKWRIHWIEGSICLLENKNIVIICIFVFTSSQFSVLILRLNGKYVAKYTRIYNLLICLILVSVCLFAGFTEISLGKKQKKSCLRKEKMVAFLWEKVNLNLVTMCYQWELKIKLPTSWFDIKY